MAKKTKLQNKGVKKNTSRTKVQGQSPKLSVKTKAFRTMLVVLILEAFVLYGNTLNHGYVLDDMSVIESNWLTQRGTDALGTIFKTNYRHGYWNNAGSLYRPLSLAMFAIEWEISPNNPTLHHAINILMYALLGALLFYFLSKILPANQLIVAFVTSALFIAHPIHTEVVANIKSRDELLSFTLLLGALILMLKHADTGKIIALISAVALYFLAFLAKESAITFLAVIPLILIFFKNKSIGKSLLTTLYFLPAALVYLGIRRSVLGSLEGVDAVDKIDNLLVGLEGAEKFATAIKLIGLYFWKLLFPVSLSNDYSFNQISTATLGSPAFLLSLIVIIGLAIIAIRLWKSKSIVSFAILYFGATFSLYTNLFITIGTSFGERLLFIPSLGFALVCAYYLNKLAKWDNSLDTLWAGSKNGGNIIFALVLGLYSFKTFDRNKAWKDNLTLYATDVKTSSNSARTHYYYGITLMKDKAMSETDENKRKQLLLESIDALNNSIRIYPNFSDAYGSLGLAYFRLNDQKSALNAYDKAIALNGGSSVILGNKGAIHFQNQDYQKALETYLLSIKKDPRFVDGLRGVASCYGTLGEFDKSIFYFLEAIKYAPDDANLYHFLGVTYQNQGEKQKADEAFAKAEELRGGK